MWNQSSQSNQSIRDDTYKFSSI